MFKKLYVIVLLIFFCFSFPVSAATKINKSDLENICKTLGGCSDKFENSLNTMLTHFNGNQVLAVERKYKFKPIDNF